MDHGGGVGLALALCVWVPATAASNDLDARPFPASELPAAWIDMVGLPELLGDAAEAEATEILREIGLDLELRTAGPGASLRRGTVRIVLLPFSVHQPPAGRCLLASARADPVAPTAWIHFPDVAKTLGLNARSVGAMPFADQRRVGVALGRIAAHEVVHLVAPDLAHAGDGLMARGTSREWLLRRQVSIDDASSRALQLALAGDR